MKTFLLGTLVVAGAATLLYLLRRGGAAQPELLDLNTASAEELMALGPLDDLLTERIIENRPYHSKLDLVARVVVPNEIYSVIKRQITVSAA
jgi:DNA uptake protein ComE-like DNA-binding protein